MKYHLATVKVPSVETSLITTGCKLAHTAKRISEASKKLSNWRKTMKRCKAFRDFENIFNQFEMKFISGTLLTSLHTTHVMRKGRDKRRTILT